MTWATQNRRTGAAPSGGAKQSNVAAALGTVAAKSCIGRPLTSESLLDLQRLAGNRATRELIAVQRTRADAKKFADRNELGLGNLISKRTVERFFKTDTDPAIRVGLLEAWNRGNRGRRICMPAKLRAQIAARHLDLVDGEVPQAATADPTRMGDLPSEADEEMPDADHERARDLVSIEEADELGAPKY